MTYSARVERLRSTAAAAELDAVAAVPGPNLVYHTGLHFHRSERPTVAFFPVSGRPVLRVPRLEVTKAESAPLPCDLVSYEDAIGPAAAFREAVGATMSRELVEVG